MLHGCQHEAGGRGRDDVMSSGAHTGNWGIRTVEALIKVCATNNEGCMHDTGQVTDCVFLTRVASLQEDLDLVN